MALPKQKMTAQAYLLGERLAETKHEYFNGDVYAMAGASRNHTLISGNVYAALHTQLRQKTCAVYQSDMRVKVSTSGLYTYPDVVVTCGVEQFEDDHSDTLLNPMVIIEVLSPSTESYDRGQKFKFYRSLPSLTDYLLISQEVARIDHFTRQADGWLLTDSEGLTGEIRLASIDCVLKLADVYEKITLVGENGV
jgi:Uma2 family endonuclease